MLAEDLSKLKLKEEELLTVSKKVPRIEYTYEKVECLKEVLEIIRPIYDIISHRIPVFNDDIIVHLDIKGDIEKGIVLQDSFDVDWKDCEGLSGEYVGSRLILFADGLIVLKERFGCWQIWPVGVNLSSELVRDRELEFEDIFESDYCDLEEILMNVQGRIEELVNEAEEEMKHE